MIIAKKGKENKPMFSLFDKSDQDVKPHNQLKQKSTSHRLSVRVRQQVSHIQYARVKKVISKGQRLLEKSSLETLIYLA